MVQHRQRHEKPPPAAAEPGDQRAGDSRADERYFRRRADETGNVHRTVHRHSGRGAGSVQDLPLYSAGTCLRTGKGTRHPRQDLFQERERIARRLTQDQHRDSAGLLQLQTGHPPPDHRNRCRTVGSRHVDGHAAFRHRPEGLYGESQLQPETLPQTDDEHLGRRRVCLAERNYGRRTCRPGQKSQRFGQPGYGDLRSRRTGAAKSSRYPLLSRLRFEPRTVTPDDHRRRGRQTDGAVRRIPGRSDRLLRRRQQLRWHQLLVPARQPDQRQEDPRNRRRTTVVPQTDPW